jgi:Lipopolysaccharide export system permease LptF/LptG
MNLHERLRAMAGRLCSARAMERLIDPALTDVQLEHRDAIAQGRPWRSRWIRLAGYFAVLSMIALCLYERTVADWRGHEARVFARAVGFGGAAFLVTALLLISPPRVDGVPANQLPYLLPQALPLAIPVGITLGVFCGLGGAFVSVRLKRATLALALAGSAGSLTATASMIPAAGQAFVEHVRLTTGKDVTGTKGAIEMTTNELRRTIDSLTQSGRPREARKMAFAYYLRWALPCAPFVLAVFALAAIPRRPVRRWIPVAAACGACFSYYCFLAAADIVTRYTILPIAAFVWLPNLAFVVASAVLANGENKLNPSVHT